MTADYLARKTSGRCVRAGCLHDACDDSVHCDPHRLELAARVRKSQSKTRPMRRARGCCVTCGRPSLTYRCEGGCRRQLPLLGANVAVDSVG